MPLGAVKSIRLATGRCTFKNCFLCDLEAVGAAARAELEWVTMKCVSLRPDECLYPVGRLSSDICGCEGEFKSAAAAVVEPVLLFGRLRTLSAELVDAL